MGRCEARPAPRAAAGIEKKRDSRIPSGLKETKDLELLTGKAEQCPVRGHRVLGEMHMALTRHLGIQERPPGLG